MISDCYVGIKQPCGCMVAVVVDDPNDKKFTAECVADFIIKGYRVEHADLDSIRNRLGPCKCQPNAETFQVGPVDGSQPSHR